MNRVKHVLTSSALYSLYCTLVIPYLTYYCEVWRNNYKTHIQLLFILQKRAIIICLNTNYKCHTKPLFYHLRSLNILTLLTLTAWCLCTRHFTIDYLQMYCPTSKKLTTAIIITQQTRALLRLVWSASRLTRTPLARRRWKRLIHQRDVTI